MRTLTLVVALACTAAFADPPADAPVKVELTAGQPAPVNGCFLDTRTCVATGAEIAGLRAENAALKQSIEEAPDPLLFLVGGAALGIVVGALAAPYLLPR